MSAINYSKWDNIELSDDEDIEVHPNIDKKSWIRLMQQKIHQEREDRRQRIEDYKAELDTNDKLRVKLSALGEYIAQHSESDIKARCLALMAEVAKFEKERKPVLFDKENSEFMKISGVDEVFTMLMHRLFEENKVQQDQLPSTLPGIIEKELPQLDKRQEELRVLLAKEEKEQKKKLTSENISKDGFSMTSINKKPDPKLKKKEPVVEVLNPGYQNTPGSKMTAPPPIDNLKARSDGQDEFGLNELTLAEERVILEYSRQRTWPDSFAFLQQHPEIVTREYSDHLMSRAFQTQMRNESTVARQCVKWSLALNYCMQLGPNGVGIFYKRMISGGEEPLRFFEEDLERTYTHLKERSKVLAASKKKDKEFTPENTNLTPEQAMAFKSFPKSFQSALMANDMEKINGAFAEMGETDAERVMKVCQDCGLITVLSDEEAKKMTAEGSLIDNDAPKSKEEKVGLVA